MGVTDFLSFLSTFGLEKYFQNNAYDICLCIFWVCKSYLFVTFGPHPAVLRGLLLALCSAVSFGRMISGGALWILQMLGHDQGSRMQGNSHNPTVSLALAFNNGKK